MNNNNYRRPRQWFLVLKLKLPWLRFRRKGLSRVVFIMIKVFSLVLSFLLDCLLFLAEVTTLGINNLADDVGRFILRLVSWLWAKLGSLFKSLKAYVVSYYRRLMMPVRSLVFNAREGHLSFYFLFKLGAKNLVYSRSRTLVTMGAIALGSGAIVFLVSFAYGLQEIVTSRLIFPNATRIADVQTASTALALDQESATEIEQVAGVEAVSPAINIAGTLEFNNAKTDVVVISAQNDYLIYSNLWPAFGELFSDEANERYAWHQDKINELKEILAQAGEVLGETQEGQVYQVGDLIADKTIRFRVKDDVYLPVREKPSVDAGIIGYVRGSILNSYPAQEVWGSTYQSVSTTGKAHQDSAGTWFGRWLKASVPLYQEQAPTVYIPTVNEQGQQIAQMGYLPQLDTHILSAEELIIETQLEQIKAEKEKLRVEEGRDGSVLGEATGSAQSTESSVSLYDEEQSLSATAGAAARSSSTNNLHTAITEEDGELEVAELSAILEAQQAEAVQQESKTSLAIVDVAREGGKEIIVSTGLLSIWDASPESIIGQSIDLEYVLSSGVISGLAGKVKSNPVVYTVVGVIQDNRSIVITPLGELESIGADRFTTLKVLGKSEELLISARSHIEALGFATQSLTDTLLQVNKLFTMMKFLLGLFGLIALVVAIFGMFNTLTISLLERTREIGVMKTFGTTDADVLRLFMIESFLIGCFGGILGIIVGTGLGFLVNALFNLFRATSEVQLFIAPISFLIFIFLLSVLVGLLTGLYPSGRAKRINALDALRYE